MSLIPISSQGISQITQSGWQITLKSHKNINYKNAVPFKADNSLDTACKDEKAPDLFTGCNLSQITHFQTGDLTTDYSLYHECKSGELYITWQQDLTMALSVGAQCQTTTIQPHKVCQQRRRRGVFDSLTAHLKSLVPHGGKVLRNHVMPFPTGLSSVTKDNSISAVVQFSPVHRCPFSVFFSQQLFSQSLILSSWLPGNYQKSTLHCC